MLIGRWSDDRRTLTITESHRIADSDQEVIDSLFKAAETADGADWGCAFDEDRHSRAVQRAYDEFARDDGAVVDDDVEGFTPDTY